MVNEKSERMWDESVRNRSIFTLVNKSEPKKNKFIFIVYHMQSRERNS